MKTRVEYVWLDGYNPSKLRSKVKYLEDRMKVMTMSIGNINNILGRFQMTENQEQGFKDITSKDNGNELI